MIKKALLSGAAFIALTSYANAADVAPVPVMDWTGFYLGVNAGLAGGDFDYDLDYDFLRDYDSEFNSVFSSKTTRATGRGAFELDSSGLLAGGQMGYNWQHDQFVFGAEADFQWTGLEGNIDGDISLSSPVGTVRRQRLGRFGSRLVWHPAPPCGLADHRSRSSPMQPVVRPMAR